MNIKSSLISEIEKITESKIIENKSLNNQGMHSLRYVKLMVILKAMYSADIKYSDFIRCNTVNDIEKYVLSVVRN
ncbi:acyl carrier protein [Vibrio cyclitrophicus]